MNKENIMVGVIGLLIGVVITGFAAGQAVNNNSTGMMQIMGMRTGTNSQGMMDDDDMSMGSMTASLQGKTGDDFDEAFISEMIIHHQGAINMAKLAQANAKHDEVKTLANDILSAQTKEIDTMRTWQTEWSYKDTSSTRSHSMMDTDY